MKEIDNLFHTFKNQYGVNIGEIRLYSRIGEGWGEDGAVEFNNKLDEMRECDEIHVRINSGGGSVFSGNAMYASLKRFPKPVKVYVDGIAASIASVIMCAGDEVICPSNAIIMIHRPLNQIAGNVDDMKENIAILEKVQETIEEAYLNKCGKKITRDKLRDLLVGEYKDGTWLSAREAQELGLVDTIEHECLVAAQIDDLSNAVINGVKMDLSSFKNTTKIKELKKNKSNDKLEETNMSNKEKQGVLDMINNVAKTLLGIKDEVQPEITNEQAEEVAETPEVAQEEILEVQNEQAGETVAEETEAQEEIVEPSAEVAEEIEPSDEETTEPVVTSEEEPSTEEVVEAPEENTEVQEEPKEETEEQTEEVVEEITDEIEPSEAVEPQAETIVPEVEASLDLVSELAKVKDELAKIKEADAQKAIALAKAELAKEVGNKFKGVPGKLEDKVELVYEIKNSALSDNSKEMILKSLENLSIQNLEACQELGHSEEILVDETDKMSQAKALAQKEGISEGQAILVLDGTKTLKQVKNKK